MKFNFQLLAEAGSNSGERFAGGPVKYPTRQRKPPEWRSKPVWTGYADPGKPESLSRFLHRHRLLLLRQPDRKMANRSGLASSLIFQLKFHLRHFPSHQFFCQINLSALGAAGLVHEKIIAHIAESNAAPSGKPVSLPL